MRLSTKGRYAVTAMFDLALHEHEGPVPLTEISTCQTISLSYLEQLFAKLRKKGLVVGVRGVGGGYRLGHPADEISIADILRAVDEKVDVSRAAEQGDPAQALWLEFSEKLYAYLDRRTLADCVSRPYARRIAARQDSENARGLQNRKDAA
ncbi:MAG: Rrf2 family transcriptional regulator [Gammaproteobacteria bacterium]|nr:Rrf2 family transcriptional regulator [Gammaproteobacteria bacterium]